MIRNLTEETLRRVYGPVYRLMIELNWYLISTLYVRSSNQSQIKTAKRQVIVWILTGFHFHINPILWNVKIIIIMPRWKITIVSIIFVEITTQVAGECVKITGSDKMISWKQASGWWEIWEIEPRLKIDIWWQ